MEVTIRFSEQVGQELLRLPDRDAFVSRAVTRALKERSVVRRPEPKASPSKWARMVERVQASSQPLGDHYQQFRKDMREFREDLRFKHDDTP